MISYNTILKEKHGNKLNLQQDQPRDVRTKVSSE